MTTPEDLTGLVGCIRVAPAYAVMTLVTPTAGGGILNSSEHVMLWWYGVGWPSSPGAHTLALHENWLGLLRQALDTTASVTVSRDAQGRVWSITLGQALMSH